MEYSIGIDIGGSLTKVGLVQNNSVVFKVQSPTPVKQGEDIFFDNIYRLIQEVLNKTNLQIGQIKNIGVAIAGMVLGTKGVLLSAANLGLKNIDIVSRIRRVFPVPVRIGNDVSCFALAQSQTSNIQNLAFIAIGTGINVGIINNGRLFTGADGASIEYGHTSLLASSRKCPCGMTACIEQFISGRSIIAACRQANLKIRNPKDVFKSSDERAKKIVNDFVERLGIVLVNITNTYRPAVIFIGGGLAECVTPFINRLNDNLRGKNYGYKNAPPVRVEISKISKDGAIIGATLC
ncbi:MAG: ROK family protein [Firmicutes bacterium]|nr:ROK family protein [Bacillota bacterium]